MNHAGTLRTRWIVSREFDLSLFFGGAALSLLVLVLALVLRAPIVALWWIWLLAFDGPHIGAAFTRTYLDRQEWTRRPGMLAGSLATFVVGPLALALGVVTSSDAPFLLFLGFATLYGYYHVVRQHYGFVALYNARSGARDPDILALDRVTLYLGSWLPVRLFPVVASPRTDAGRFVRGNRSVGTRARAALGARRRLGGHARPIRVGSTCAGVRSASRKSRISSSPCYCTARSTSASRASSRSMARRTVRIRISS